MIVHLAARPSDCGARVELHHDTTGQKANLFATLGPEDARAGHLVLSGYTHVVPADHPDSTADPFAMRSMDGRAALRPRHLRI